VATDPGTRKGSGRIPLGGREKLQGIKFQHEVNRGQGAFGVGWTQRLGGEGAFCGEGNATKGEVMITPSLRTKMKPLLLTILRIIGKVLWGRSKKVKTEGERLPAHRPAGTDRPFCSR